LSNKYLFVILPVASIDRVCGNFFTKNIHALEIRNKRCFYFIQTKPKKQCYSCS